MRIAVALAFVLVGLAAGGAGWTMGRHYGQAEALDVAASGRLCDQAVAAMEGAGDRAAAASATR